LNQDRDKRIDFMTEDQVKRIDDFLTKINNNRSELGTTYTRMEKEQKAYSGEQEIKENRPNSRVNIINANIEGQVAALIEQNLAVTCRGEGPSDQPYASWGRIGLDWSFRKNRIKKILEAHERRRELFGWAWLKLYWDSEAVKGFGLAKLTCVPPNSIFIDLKINDPLRVQEAEYIAEPILQSKTWAKHQERYGDRANNIFYGGTDRATLFQKEKTLDDDDAFWLIQLWTMTDGVLRLEEFSDDGVLLYDSFEDGDYKKDGEHLPYYRYNKYPYFLTILYPEEGELYGFGDGKLLRPLQDMINDLYDQIRRAARPNRIMFDPESEVELEDIDEDDGPIPCVNPNGNIKVAEVGKVNPALWQLLSNIHQEVQRVTRFSELMMGQGAKVKTATESSIQQQQGASATDHKKTMLQETLVDVCEYMLDMMMENYTEAKAFRIDEKKEDYEWIDFRQMNEVPVLKPATEAYTRQYQDMNPGGEMPKWMELEGGDKKSVDFDIEINIGAGLPKNKAFLWQMLEKLAPLVVEGRNVISWQEVRNFMEDFLGLPLEDGTQILPPEMMGQGIPGQPGAVPMPGEMPLQGANVPGMSPGGNPMASNLPPNPGVL